MTTAEAKPATQTCYLVPPLSLYLTPLYVLSHLHLCPWNGAGDCYSGAAACGRLVLGWGLT
jgi:hypothetical protein